MKLRIAFWMLALSVLTSPSWVASLQAQDRDSARTMMDTKAAKSKMMEPAMMMATEKSMMSDKSMVPSMMAKEMLMNGMMQDEKSMAMVNKAAMATGSDKPAMIDEKQLKMASEKLVASSDELQLLFQELVARHLAAQKMAMAKSAPTDGKKTMMPKMPVMSEASMMESKKEMMAGEAMTMMMARETLVMALMKDPEVMSLVEKQAQKLQDSAIAKTISDENLMMKSGSMTKDTKMMKTVAKDAMVRSTMKSGQIMEKKK